MSASSQRAAAAFRIDTRPAPRFQRQLALLVVGLAGLALSSLYLTLQAHAPELFRFWLLLVALAPALVLARRAAQIRPRQLRWDGQAWWLQDQLASAEERQVQVELLFDFDAYLLLRVQAVPSRLLGARIYIPLASAQQAQWSHLRACLYATRSALASP